MFVQWLKNQRMELNMGTKFTPLQRTIGLYNTWGLKIKYFYEQLYWLSIILVSENQNQAA